MTSASVLSSVLMLSAMMTTSNAFMVGPGSALATTISTRQTFSQQTRLYGIADDEEVEDFVRGEYTPGGADTAFARKFRHLVGAEVKTMSESLAQFTKGVGYTINPLYKNMITDLVGTTHFIVVTARFERDPIWSLGLITTLDVLLKNYPERDMAQLIKTSFINAMDLNEDVIRSEAKQLSDWLDGKTKVDIEDALDGNGDNIIATTVNKIKENEFWMYSRYFGIGLLRSMQLIGMDPDKDEAETTIEFWMKEKIGRSWNSALGDTDLFFRTKERLEMMETMMKEIEIREKKRLADRLEKKAERALEQAEREAEYAAEMAAAKAAQKEMDEAAAAKAEEEATNKEKVDA